MVLCLCLWLIGLLRYGWIGFRGCLCVCFLVLHLVVVGVMAMVSLDLFWVVIGFELVITVIWVGFSCCDCSLVFTCVVCAGFGWVMIVVLVYCVVCLLACWYFVVCWL